MIIHGDCLEVLRGMEADSVDSIVTDPPYGLSFMGKKWDYDVPSVEIWAECLRVLKPGGHMLAFAGTRTQHRMAVRIEDAGFEIRDMIAWVYGSGFPKSLDVSKAIDKRGGNPQLIAEIGEAIKASRLARGLTVSQCDQMFCNGSTNWFFFEGRKGGQRAPSSNVFQKIVEQWPELAPFAQVIDEAEREVVEKKQGNLLAVAPGQSNDRSAAMLDITAPATDAAKQWQGWGTALKPALETVTFASKPYTDQQEQDIILSNLIRLEARLWLLSSVSAAEKSSTSSQSEYGAACAIAQWNAEELISTRGDLCARMGTSLFELATTTSLSIVSSWRRTLAESWNDGSTSTTETKSSATTDLRTLKFSLSQITHESIIRACSLPGGFSANASTAESHFNASLSLLQSIRTLSATERAMSQAQHEHQDAGVKPNLDPCIMARKPLEGTVAANVLAHGTGALNIDGCRVAGEPWKAVAPNNGGRSGGVMGAKAEHPGGEAHALGRWPANFIHDGSTEVVDLFPVTTSGGGDKHGRKPSTFCESTDWERFKGTSNGGDTGSAARFFYCAKASKSDRDEGLDGFEARYSGRDNGFSEKLSDTKSPRANHHPTVKPTDLMRYLCRLVTPPKGTVLDPFAGSGSTGKAAVLEGFNFIGIEREAEYVAIAKARIDHAQGSVLL